MNFIVEMIVESVIRAVTYAVVYSVSQTIHTSIKKSVSGKINTKLSQFVGANGEVDEEKINSLIQVDVFPMELGQYQVSVKEEVFGVLDYNGVTTKNTELLIKNIKKHLVSQKLRAKILKREEEMEVIQMLLEGFE